MKKRKICVVTGTRAEYSLLKPVMEAIKKNPRLSLSIVATGMHLSTVFGYTIKDIERDCFCIDSRVRMLNGEDTSASMAKSVGRGIIGMVDSFQDIKPDIVLVLGDRTESLAAAVAAAYMNIPVAHMHGGDSAKAGLDEYARHAITKLSNIHLPATKKSANRIIRMGEDPKNVYVVGAPGLDSVLRGRSTNPSVLSKRYSLDPSKQFILVIQHPVTTEINEAGRQMNETLAAVTELKLQSVVIYPNSDAGGRKMISVIRRYQKSPYIRAYPSLPHEDYLGLMQSAGAIVGNSSSGIIEAPSFGLPSVNLGTRQEGREAGKNVINAGHNRRDIKSALHKALYDKSFKKKVDRCANPYGDGKTGKRVANILAKIKIDKKLIQKKLTY